MSPPCRSARVRGEAAGRGKQSGEERVVTRHSNKSRQGRDEAQQERGRSLFKGASADDAIKAAIAEREISDPFTQSRLAAQKVREITEQRR